MRCLEGSRDVRLEAGRLKSRCSAAAADASRSDRRTAQASIDGVTLDLTGHQFELLAFLASRPGQPVSLETISQILGGATRNVGRSADVHMHRIRTKLRDLASTTCICKQCVTAATLSRWLRTARRNAKHRHTGGWPQEECENSDRAGYVTDSRAKCG